MKKKISLQGNFIVLISFIATGFVVFFSLFSVITKTYLEGRKDAEINLQLSYAAESVLDRLSYEYNQNDNFEAATTINDTDSEKICLNFNFSFLGINADQAVLDFGVNCQDQEEGEVEGFIKKKATRMVLKETSYLDRYQLFEYRLTKKEFLESGNSSEYETPQKLKITWSNDLGEKDIPLEIILVVMKNSSGNDISKNIQVYREIIKEDNSYDLGHQGQDLDFTNYQYLVFLKSGDQPVSFSIAGVVDNSGTEEFIKIPSRYLYLSAEAVMDDEKNPLKMYNKKISAQKQIYSDFDSDFPYIKYEIR